MDWRLTNQDKYLKGVMLKYDKFKKESINDHAHCEFCWYTFLDGMTGYTTLDETHWICSNCYNDFRELFKWTIK